MKAGSLEAAVQAGRKNRRSRPPAQRNGLEALGEADTPDRIVDAMNAAAESLGFPFAQLMIAAPAGQPSALVITEGSDRLLRFDRAILASSDLSSPYDLGLGDPVNDPVLVQLRRSPVPVVWDGETYIDAGFGSVRDWCFERDRGHGVTVQLRLSIAEMTSPLAVILSVQRRDRIRPEEHARAAADVALLAMHAAVGGGKALVPLLLSSKRAASPLTPAMRQYLAGAERGKTAGETADIVGRSYSTIKNVLAQALERLGCANKADAVRRARANGWL